MASITIRNLDDEIKQRLRVRAAERRATGRPISQFDCQIAAIARAREATVATRNTSDYEGCGIALMNPGHSAPACN